MNHSNTTIPEDEIDFKTLGQKTLQLIQYPFVLFYRHKLITGLFILLAVSVAIFFKMSVTKTYTSSFIIRPNDRSEKFHVRILDDMRSLLKHKDWQTLSQALNMDSLQLKSIADLQIYASSNKVGHDSINYTEVVVECTDYHLFIPLQNALLYYLENNPYFNKIKTVELTRMREENPMVENDLKMLDSLKKLQITNYALQKNMNQNALLLSEASDPVAFYNMSIERLNKKYKLMAQNAFLDNFQLIKSCVVVKKPSWPPRIILLLCIILPIFLFICFILLAIKTKLKA
ncbi:MAG: hypothetical protein WCR21_12570 [Bacteroidota bacterium]